MGLIKKFQNLPVVLLLFLLLQSLYGWIAPIVQGRNGWISHPDLLLADRILYGGVFLLVGIPLHLYLIPLFQLVQSERPRTLFKKLLQGVLPRSGLPASAGMGLLAGIGLYLFMNLVHFWQGLFHAPDVAPPIHDALLKALNSNGLTPSLLIYTGLATPLLEELYYRFLMMGSLRAGEMGLFLAALVQAVCFGLAHHYFVAPLLGIVGLVLGLLYGRYGILASVTAHGIYNLLILYQSTVQG